MVIPVNPIIWSSEYSLNVITGHVTCFQTYHLDQLMLPKWLWVLGPAINTITCMLAFAQLVNAMIEIRIKKEIILFWSKVLSSTLALKVKLSLLFQCCMCTVSSFCLRNIRRSIVTVCFAFTLASNFTSQYYHYHASFIIIPLPYPAPSSHHLISPTS